MVKIGTRFSILNWWIGSIVMVPSRFGAPCAKLHANSLFPAFRRVAARRRAGSDSRGTHHIEHARDEAEQKKYNEPPRRDTEQPVDKPAEAGTDQHASNEFAREPKALGVARCSRRPISTRTFGRRSRTLACGA